MRLGLGHSLARRGFVAAAADPAAAYIAAITSAGATVTAPKQAAISTFISGEIAAGRWDSIKRLYLPIWESAAPNAICMKSLTSSTFIGGVTHGAGYIQGNGTTGYANTNTTLASVNVTKDSYYAGYLRIEAGALSEYSFGVTESGLKALNVLDTYFFNEETEQNYFAYATARVSNNALAHSDPPSTLFTIGGTTSSRFLKNRTSSGVTTRATSSATNTQELATAEFCLMTINSPTGVSSARSNSKFGAFFFGTALTDAQDTAYTLALKTLWESTTGLTLP